MLSNLYSFYLKSENIRSTRYRNVFYWWLFKSLRFLLFHYYNNFPFIGKYTNPNSDVIVSLTSFPARIQWVHLTIKSIMAQTEKAHKIVLWLSEEEFPGRMNDLPPQLLKLMKSGLEIYFCENIKAHKKYYFSFLKFKDFRIVTIDDDVFYPNDLLKSIIRDSNRFPDCIIAHRVREMIPGESSWAPYREWPINAWNPDEPSLSIMPTGVGGVLYRPQLFSESIYDLDNIKTLCLNNDDIWLKANSINNGIKIKFTGQYQNSMIEIKQSQSNSLYSMNVFHSTNDKMISDTFAFFSIQHYDFFTH